MASTFSRLQRRLRDLLDVLRPAVQRVPLAAVRGIGFPAELRRDHHLAAKRSERLADQFFVHERTVHFGRIEERHAALDRRLQKRNHLLLVFGRSVAQSSFPCTRIPAPILPGRFFPVCVSALPSPQGRASHPSTSMLRTPAPDRFPNPANLLPDPVRISDFVHTRSRSAVR